MGLFSFLESKTDKINGVEFPKFFGGKKITSNINNTKKYKRKTYYYTQIDELKLQEYIGQINSYGFVPKTKVRYENLNGDYVILEKDPCYYTITMSGIKKEEAIHIAFHVIKK